MNGWIADLSLWSFPASLILGAAFALGVWACDRYYRTARWCRVLADARAAVWLLVAVALGMGIEGIWGFGLYRSWPFIATAMLLTFSLGLVTLRRLRTRPDAGFLLNHAGLFLIAWGMLFGAPDYTEGRMIVHKGQSESLAYTSSGQVTPLPFEVQLDRFSIDYYDDGQTPRQFRSQIRLGDRVAEVSVNSPVRHKGYMLYQDSYDTRKGEYTVLLVVRDPWLWVVWIGVALLAVGAIFMIFRKR